MRIRIAAAAALLVAGLLGGLIAVTPVTASTAVLADPTSTAVDPTYAISGETGAPLGDAHPGTDPLVPFGTEPQVPVTPGYVNRNHDEGVTTNGQVDLPF